MERKRRGGCGRGEEEVSTQESIRRAVEEGGDDGDDDFKLSPWLCAVEFVSRQGKLPSTTSLSSAPKFLEIGRIDRAVAVIKSCTPNGFGDLMVTLKDPTATIGASIHRKVFADGEFGKEIFVGSVLILQKVAVFAPSRSALYLNITKNNVVKVFSKDSGPPTKQNTYTSAVKPISGQHKEAPVNVEESSMEVEMTQGVNNGNVQFSTFSGSVDNHKETAKENSTNSFFRGDQNNISAEQVVKKVFRKEIISDEQRVRKDNSEEITRTNGVEKEKQSQPTAAIASLPEWTDEQLNELLSEDDGCFF